MEVMAQDVKGGNEVTPLDQLSQGPPFEGIPCYPNFICYRPGVYQDLLIREMIWIDVEFLTKKKHFSGIFWDKVEVAPYFTQ